MPATAPRRRTAIEKREPCEENKALAGYIDLLRWCDALVLVYPTWWYAMPAILKVCATGESRSFARSSLYTASPSPPPPPIRPFQGWIERTFLPHAAFTLPGPGEPSSVVGLVPQLQNIKSVKQTEACNLYLTKTAVWSVLLIHPSTSAPSSAFRRKVGVVTTYGSDFKVIRYVGDPGRRIISRGETEKGRRGLVGLDTHCCRDKLLLTR